MCYVVVPLVDPEREAVAEHCLPAEVTFVAAARPRSLASRDDDVIKHCDCGERDLLEAGSQPVEFVPSMLELATTVPPLGVL